MQADRHFCRSKNLDRVRKLHFLFVDVVSELLFCCLSDLFCRYASEYFSTLADFDCYGNLFVLNLFRESLCLSELLCCCLLYTSLQVMRDSGLFQIPEIHVDAVHAARCCLGEQLLNDSAAHGCVGKDVYKRQALHRIPLSPPSVSGRTRLSPLSFCSTPHPFPPFSRGKMCIRDSYRCA